ncbi:hypothetical protein IFM89_023867 [Coptis chinensis]|uniref:Uncharacterized protein n=1 Tax=Coptis chinensis TaxID=261450 RepID=A0A835H0Q6_9MAGN|nr:hypothetical protein IFM89_023867 [Coptis chinensis]
MDSGFAADDQYNVYGKKLCTAKSTFDSIYKPKKDTDTDMYGGEDEQLDMVPKTDRFKPDKGFAGANETAGPREKPIEFEKEPDPFELDHLWTKVMKGNLLDGVEGLSTAGMTPLASDLVELKIKLEAPKLNMCVAGGDAGVCRWLGCLCVTVGCGVLLVCAGRKKKDEFRETAEEFKIPRYRIYFENFLKLDTEFV